MSLDRLRDSETYQGTAEERVHDSLADIYDRFILKDVGLADCREVQEGVLPEGVRMLEVARAARIDLMTATRVVRGGIVLKNDKISLEVRLGERPDVRSTIPRARGALILGQSVQRQQAARTSVMVSLR